MFFFHYVFIQLSLLVLSVSAFYPFIPPWMCIEQGECLGTKKRSDETIIADVASTLKDTFTLKIRQKLPSNDLSPEIRISRYIDRLTKRFELRNTRRSNIYPFISSIAPTQAYSAAIDQDGTDFSYFAVANFGSNATPLYMLMDTGAASSWVMGSACTSDACLKHNTFGPSNSKTYQPSSDSFAIGYGTGSVSGLYATDTISFAGFSFPFTFGAANQTSKDFLNFPMDGILGLSQTKGSKPLTFLESLSNAKILTSNIFGINLNRAADGTNDGEINFGAPDKSKYVGSLSYTSTVTLGGNWNIPVEDAGMNGKGAGFLGKTAIIDSGTSYAFIPPADAKLLFALVPGAVLSSDGGSYSVPCSTTAPLQFRFSGVSYNVSSKDWVGGMAGSNLCTSNVYPRDATGTGAWLLGDVFLKNVYAVFDVDQNRVGFGLKSVGSSTSSTSSTSLSNSATSASTASTASSITVQSTTSSNTGSTVVATSSSRTTSPSSISSSTSNTSVAFNAAITSMTPSQTVIPQSATAAPPTTTTAKSASSQIHTTLVAISAGIIMSLFANI